MAFLYSLQGRLSDAQKKSLWPDRPFLVAMDFGIAGANRPAILTEETGRTLEHSGVDGEVLDGARPTAALRVAGAPKEGKSYYAVGTCIPLSNRPFGVRFRVKEESEAGTRAVLSCALFDGKRLETGEVKPVETREDGWKVFEVEAPFSKESGEAGGGTIDRVGIALDGPSERVLDERRGGLSSEAARKEVARKTDVPGGEIAQRASIRFVVLGDSSAVSCMFLCVYGRLPTRLGRFLRTNQSLSPRNVRYYPTNRPAIPGSIGEAMAKKKSGYPPKLLVATLLIALSLCAFGAFVAVTWPRTRTAIIATSPGFYATVDSLIDAGQLDKAEEACRAALEIENSSTPEGWKAKLLMTKALTRQSRT